MIKKNYVQARVNECNVNGNCSEWKNGNWLKKEEKRRRKNEKRKSDLGREGSGGQRKAKLFRL